MSKVTIGHDSCTTWTCGSEQGASFDFKNEELEGECATGLAIDMYRTLSMPFMPVYWLYKGAKAVSKSVRTSR